jgi:hypothetical protein
LFLQVNTLFSAHLGPSRLAPNSEPNHANIVNWTTYLRWRTPPAAAKTRPRRAGAEYRKSRPVAIRHAEQTHGCNGVGEIHCATKSSGEKSSTPRDRAHHGPVGRHATNADVQFLELATCPMPFSNRRTSGPWRRPRTVPRPGERIRRREVVPVNMREVICHATRKFAPMPGTLHRNRIRR